MNYKVFFTYLFVMAITTYLIRMIPLVSIKKKIRNKFLLSFFYYIPYAVLSVMTIPAIFYSTSNKLSAVMGFLCAFILSYFEKSLITVAAFSCFVVFLTQLL